MEGTCERMERNQAELASREKAIQQRQRSHDTILWRWYTARISMATRLAPGRAQLRIWRVRAKKGAYIIIVEIVINELVNVRDVLLVTLVRALLRGCKSASVPSVTRAILTSRRLRCFESESQRPIHTHGQAMRETGRREGGRKRAGIS